MMLELAPSRLQDTLLLAEFQQRTRAGKWECIEWTGARKDGYGIVQIDGRTFQAHRVAWMLRWKMPVPYDLVIDHLCCNKGCVNADHTEAVTAAENMRRILHPPAGWISVGSPRYPRRRKRAGVTCYPRRLARVVA